MKKFENSIYNGIICMFIFVAFTVGQWQPPDNPCLCKEFRCETGSFCLHAARVCNGYKDCPHGEDEKSFDGSDVKCSRSPKKPKCSPNEFKCKFGGCIKLTEVCDGKIHCYGGVDEATDFCNWVYGNSSEPSPLH